MEQILTSNLGLLTLTVGLYCLGMSLYRATRLVLLHPVLITFVAMIFLLRAFGVSYERYEEATSVLNFALGMSVVALGYLMYEQMERMRGRLLPILCSTLTGCLVGILSVVYIARALVTITSVVVFCTGIFGSLFGGWILKRCGISDPLATGYALGSAAHGIGTARAIEMGAAEGALSGVAMALMGVATALLLPLVEKYLY